MHLHKPITNQLFPLSSYLSFSRSFFDCSPCDSTLFICFHRLASSSSSCFFFLFTLTLSSTMSLTTLRHSTKHIIWICFPNRIYCLYTCTYIYLLPTLFFFLKQFYVLSNIASFCFIIKKLLLIICGLVNQRQNMQTYRKVGEKNCREKKK